MQNKPLRDYKGGKSTIPTGDYKLQASDFKVIEKEGLAGLLVVVDLMVIGPPHQKEFYGKHTEIAFSMAESAEGVAKSFLIAMGCTEDDTPPRNSAEELENFLRRKCKKNIVMATVTLGKDRTGQYDQNSIDKPWENIGASVKSEGDYGDDGIPF